MNNDIDQLRLEIAEAAEKIRAAYLYGLWASFHFHLGVMHGLTARLYEANAKAERE